MLYWLSSMQIASKLESVRAAEKKLLEYARKYAAKDLSLDGLNIKSFDTIIPQSVIPWAGERGRPVDLQIDLNEKAGKLIIHGIHIESKQSLSQEDSNNSSTDTPLVLLHGYMNASAYFYRNLLGLARYYRSIYSIDMLGWGLSSRPNFNQLKDTSVESAEDFFVESLEAWRLQNNMDRMILAGHSMGGYLSVAYCERYPQHVEKLILLSPVGVNDENSQNHKEREARINSSFRSRAMFGIFRAAFASTTPASVLRTLTESRAYSMSLGYVQNRLPEIEDPEEQVAVADYVFQSNTLPGSGEYAIQRILESNVVAKKPLQFRIPNLKVDSVSFLYGSHDWMDIMGGLETQRLCEDAPSADVPDIKVYVLNNAGHLLMLQNWQAFNAGVILCGGGHVDEEQKADLKLMTPMASTLPEPQQASAPSRELYTSS